MLNNIFTVIQKLPDKLSTNSTAHFFRVGEAVVCTANHGLYVQLDSGLMRFGGTDVFDVLNSTSTTDALSANQGRIYKRCCHRDC